MTPEELKRLEREFYDMDDDLRSDDNYKSYENAKNTNKRLVDFDDYLEEKFPKKWEEYQEKKRKLAQAREEERRRKAGEAPIPDDKDFEGTRDTVVDLPEEAGKVTVAPPPPVTKPATKKDKKPKPKQPEQLELDFKRSAQAAKLMNNAALARRAIKDGKAGMDILKALRIGLTKGAGIPIELLSILAGPGMKAIVEEAEDKKPKGI